jgi:hypothetical protein
LFDCVSEDDKIFDRKESVGDYLEKGEIDSHFAEDAR